MVFVHLVSRIVVHVRKIVHVPAVIHVRTDSVFKVVLQIAQENNVVLMVVVALAVLVINIQVMYVVMKVNVFQKLLHVILMEEIAGRDHAMVEKRRSQEVACIR